MTATAVTTTTRSAVALTTEERGKYEKLLDAWVKAQEFTLTDAPRDPAWLARVADAIMQQPTFPLTQVLSEFTAADTTLETRKKERRAIQEFIKDGRAELVRLGRIAPDSALPLLDLALKGSENRVEQATTLHTEIANLKSEIAPPPRNVKGQGKTKRPARRKASRKKARASR